MASVYRRGGVYWASIRDYQGKRHVFSTGMRNRRDAVLIASTMEVRHAMVRLNLADPSELEGAERRAMAIDPLIDRWGRETIESAPQRRTAVNACKAFCQAAGIKSAGGFSSAELVIALQDWVQGEVGKLKRESVNKKLWHVQAFAHWLWSGGYTRFDHAARVRPLKGAAIEDRRIDHRALTPKEAEHLHAGDELYPLLWRMRLWTGVRGEEAMRLERRDFDFEKLVLHIRKEVSKNGLEAWLPLTVDLGAQLGDRFGLQHAGARVFASLSNDRTRRSDALQKRCEELGLERINERSMRMTFVTWLEAAHVELGVRMKLRRDKGRGSERLTAWTYSDSAQVMAPLRKGVDQMAAWHAAELAGPALKEGRA